jgi:predicted permease
VLLVGAGLCLRSFVKLQTTDPGFNAKNVLAVPLASTTSGFIATNTFNRQLLERITALPGVQAASLASYLPMTPGGATLGGGPDMIEGYQARPGEFVVLSVNSVGPDYFKTLGIPLLRGREFTHRDKWGQDMPVIVNETTARRYWRGQDAIGKRIRNNRLQMEVVGVIRDYRRFSLWEPPVPEVFWPIEEAERGHLLVRTAGNPHLMLAAVRNEIHSLDKEIDVSNSIMLGEVLDRSLSTQRSALLILGTFAVVALVLSGIGIYGVMSYVVSLRTREIGVRMAMGAQSGDVLSQVLRDGMRLAGGGLICGLAGSIGATRLIRSWLYEVTPTDPLTFVAIAILLGAVALLACWFPARRAAKVDPMEALRYE